MKQTMSLVAATSPAWQAAPKPRCGTGTTVAPWSAAMLADASVEPLSATMGWKPAGIRDRTQGSASASFRQGRMTSILMARQ